MTKQYSWKISEAVCCAMNLDDPGIQKEFGAMQFKYLHHGMRVTGTLEELASLAYHMTRESGWDMPPQTINACNKSAAKLQKFVDEQRAGKDLP